ncbi:MAG: hypothetical protein AB7P20_17065, partial [Rhizobiaceae bacterium]
RPDHTNKEGESTHLDQGLRPKPYMKAGHFSAKIPGQLSTEINTLAHATVSIMPMDGHPPPIMPIIPCCGCA